MGKKRENLKLTQVIETLKAGDETKYGDIFQEREQKIHQ